MHSKLSYPYCVPYIYACMHTLTLTNITVWSKVAWRAEADICNKTEAFATV